MNVLNKKIRQMRGIERSANELTLEFLKYIDLAAVVKLNEVCGFGGKRLQDYYKDSYTLLTDAMAKYGGDGDSEYEQVMLCKTAFTSQLKGLGFDVAKCDEDLLKNYNHIGARRMNASEWRRYKTRADFVIACDDTIQVFIMSICMYMHSQHRYGAGRLEKLYTAIRDEYMGMVDNYLSFHDDYVLVRQAEMRAYIKGKCGIEVDYGKADKV